MNKIFLYAFAFLMAPSSIYAGGTSSSGGDLLSNHKNPWFLENMKTVKYCVTLDQVNFGQTEEVAKAKILAALTYWKDEFSRAKRDNEIGVATQEFLEIPCNENPDLSFQFGVLSDDQKRLLDEPRDLVGVAVLNQYDEVNLRGRGFIYVSPQSGSLGMKDPQPLPHPWERNNGRLLELVLIHELGHVFGLDHVGGIMAHDFPRTAVSLGLGDVYAKAGNNPYFFEPRDGEIYTQCHSYSSGMTAIGFDEQPACIQLKTYKDGHSNEMRFDLFAVPTRNGPLLLVGSAELMTATEGKKSVVNVVLTDKQKVFTSAHGMLSLYGMGTSKTSWRYTNTKGKTTILYSMSDVVGIAFAGLEDPEIFTVSRWDFSSNRN